MAKNTAASWAVGNLKRIAKQQGALIKNKPRAIPPGEQVRRFLAGEERWRLEEGLVSPSQWAEYQETMLEKLGI